MIKIDAQMSRGYRLVVGWLLAMEQTGVRFSLPAQKQNARVGRFVFVQKYSPSREPTLRGSSEHTRVCSRATRVVMRTRSVRSTSVLPPRVALASLRRRQAWPPATQGAASVRPPLVASQKGRYRFFLPPPAKIFCKYESSFLGLLAAVWSGTQMAALGALNQRRL